MVPGSTASELTIPARSWAHSQQARLMRECWKAQREEAEAL